jgi:hypothetical protein
MAPCHGYRAVGEAVDFFEFNGASIEATDDGPAAGRAEIEGEVGLGHCGSFRVATCG